MLRRTNNLGMTRREEKRVGKQIRKQTDQALASQPILTTAKSGKSSGKSREAAGVAA